MDLYRVILPAQPLLKFGRDPRPDDSQRLPELEAGRPRADRPALSAKQSMAGESEKRTQSARPWAAAGAAGRRKMQNKANRGWAGRDMDAPNGRWQLP
jgi:hypothetical protein